MADIIYYDNLTEEAGQHLQGLCDSGHRVSPVLTLTGAMQELKSRGGDPVVLIVNLHREQTTGDIGVWDFLETVGKDHPNARGIVLSHGYHNILVHDAEAEQARLHNALYLPDDLPPSLLEFNADHRMQAVGMTKEVL